MVYYQIELSPGSAEQVFFAIKDKNKKPIDVTAGIWSARLLIVRYPGDSNPPFHTTGTIDLTNTDSLWLEPTVQTSPEDTIVSSNLVMTPDPDITKYWTFTRYHYDCYLSGPDVDSKPVLLSHGPFILDK